ncbi:transposable element Tc1 transposase [Trichonephila clavipes]|nr:transposable element Tc1 transposase [Trichonephila clavipes]
MVCGAIAYNTRSPLVLIRGTMTTQRHRSLCWTKTKQVDVDVDLSSLDARGNDGRGQSHSPRCTTAREDRRIVCMTVMDGAATLRTVAQQIQSVTHHSVSARTTRCRLQWIGMSPRRPLLRLPLTGNHRRMVRRTVDLENGRER